MNRLDHSVDWVLYLLIHEGMNVIDKAVEVYANRFVGRFIFRFWCRSSNTESLVYAYRLWLTSNNTGKNLIPYNMKLLSRIQEL